jgi:rhodanese-related sulfurtransferase
MMMGGGITDMNGLSLKSPLRCISPQRPLAAAPIMLVDESAFSGVISKLPCHANPRDAIKRITVDTFHQLLLGKYHPLEQVMVIDCRYSYEFAGGHIEGAISVNTPELVESILFKEPAREHRCIIFHCEFSSERAPRMALHVRNRDRLLNAARYPFLFYPEIYILEGGYKAYFDKHPEETLPPNCYVPMRDPACKVKLQLHQKLKHVYKSKWTSGPAGKPVKRLRDKEPLEDTFMSNSQPLFVTKVKPPASSALLTGEDFHSGCTQDMSRLLTSVNDFEVSLHADLSSTF